MGYADCLRDVRVLRSKSLSFEQFRKTVLQVPGAAIDQTQVFVQLRQGATVAAQCQCFLQLGYGLRPVAGGRRGQGKIAQRLSPALTSMRDKL